MPVPPPMNITQPQPAILANAQHPSHPTGASEADSTSANKSESSANAEPGTATAPKIPSLSSLLEFGAVPSSNAGDVRPAGVPANPYPFPFVTPGPGVPFSPQAAAGMTTYYRPPLPPSVPLSTTALDVNPSTPKATTTSPKKKSAAKRSSTEVISQNILDEPEPPKKKARKTNARGKGKAKKNETDGENDTAEDKASPSPPSQPSKKKKKAKKGDSKDSAPSTDNDAAHGTAGGASQNLLTQMGLGNNSLAPPPLQTSSSINGITPTASAQQQAQIAAMYSMTPNFGAYSTFPGAFNPAFPGTAYPGAYPPPYGFHPAFGTPPAGQPFPFIPPTAANR